ncbi:hypothetical protein BN2475_1000001 [Paraburkholderia ribeironis]|uniref:Uncharacterized protein n=1 Tax=Paraburkholderia ribeironis TaxID=1247936 RepID=A0A1N7SLV4_9BURK|nr:hypothetical protein BN2475_1000001 [Paraburkholderia ribeironis]
MASVDILRDHLANVTVHPAQSRGVMRGTYTSSIGMQNRCAQIRQSQQFCFLFNIYKPYIEARPHTPSPDSALAPARLDLIVTRFVETFC